MIKGELKIDTTPLDNLKKSLITKIVRRAVTKASKLMKDQVKSNAKNIARTGGLARSIGTKIKTYSGSVVAVIGARYDYQKNLGLFKKGKKKGTNKIYKPAYLQSIIEGGSRRSKADHFLADALSSTSQAFFDQVETLIREGIDAELSK